jgi:DNA-directed RNA polymerase subunit M/transcription elongation factor TFIIS
MSILTAIIAGVVLTVVVAIALVRYYRCPKCGGVMRRVCVIEPPIRLLTPQQIKEIGGPPYDILIFKCRKCGYEEQRRSVIQQHSPG